MGSAGTNFISNATRLNCNAGVDPVLPNHNQNGWYNPAAFSNPVAATFGNCSRSNGGQLSWNNGSNSAPSTSFGKITSTLSPMRQIQFALKFKF